MSDLPDSPQKRANHPLTRIDTRMARREVRKGVNPLEMIMDVSRHYYKGWQEDPENKDLARLTVTTAEKAAPYIHARRASVQNEHNVKGELTINIGGKDSDA